MSRCDLAFVESHPSFQSPAIHPASLQHIHPSALNAALISVTHIKTLLSCWLGCHTNTLTGSCMATEWLVWLSGNSGMHCSHSSLKENLSAGQQHVGRHVVRPRSVLYNRNMLVILSKRLNINYNHDFGFPQVKEHDRFQSEVYNACSAHRKLLSHQVFH